VRQVTVDGDPINPRATYRLATSDFVQQGGSGFEVLAEARNITPTGITIRQALIEFIRAEHVAKRAIQNRAEGRFRVDCGQSPSPLPNLQTRR
jgi:2',3'-cyclic-nucleotide 2'-phosphodiesterase (5'-nucleotidase family)